MNIPILYSRTDHGSIQQWQIIIDNGTFYTIEGLVNGKLTTSLPTVCLPKNEGKKNRTSAHEQAIKEAHSKWKKKKEQGGYFEELSHIDNETFFEPMLAKKYEDVFSSELLPVYVNVKLDGIRCIVTNKGMFSRNGKLILSATHIRKSLQWFFDKNPLAILDGELYCGKLNNDFNKIVSLIKKTKPTQEDLEESANVIEYWIYDFPSEKSNFKERYEALDEKLFKLNSDSKIIKVDAHLVNCVEKLDTLYGEAITNGFEGQMIRLNGKYENKRSKNLLKRKEFMDDEFTILDIIEGEGSRTGTAGYMTFKTQAGISFKSNIKGSHKYLKEVLKNKNILIGKQATIKFFNYTPDKEIPRFPYVIKIDRKSYE